MTQEYEDSRDVSLLAIDQYMRGLRWSERLTQEEEARLIERVERGKRERTKECPNQWIMSLAKHASEQLVEGYQPYVAAIARRLASRCRGLELLDLIQEGSIGVMGAIETNDPSKGYSLRVLVGVRARGMMLNALEKMNGVRLHCDARKMVIAARKAQQELFSVLGRSPSYPELAAHLGWTLERLVEVMEWHRCDRVESLQGMLREDEDEDRRDFVSLFQASVDAEVSRSRELEQALQHAIATALTNRQREVFCARYGLEDGSGQERTYLELAAHFGVVPGAIHNVYSAARKRLRTALTPVVEGSRRDMSA